MANKIPNSRQKHGQTRSGPSEKNVVRGGRSKPSPAPGANSLMGRGKMKGPGVSGQ